MWYHSISLHTGMSQHQSFWRGGGIFSSAAEKQELFKCELHIKGTVLYVWSCRRCIKNWIVVCYRGSKYPQKTAFILLLESDVAGTSLSGHLSAVLFLMWCCKSTGDREQHLWSYWSPEGCIKKWYGKTKCYSCLYKKCGLWLCCISYLGQAVRHKECKLRFETFCFSPLTRVSINVADSSELYLLFLISLRILSGWPIINKFGFRKDMKLWIGPIA